MDPVTVIRLKNILLLIEMFPEIYNTIGKEVAELVNEMQSSNEYTVKFDASKFSSGIYYYTIKAGNNFIQTKKMILVK